MLKKLASSLLILVLMTSCVWAADRWLHVKVEKQGDDAEKVRVNVPLSLVEQLLPLIDAKQLRSGRVQLGDKKIHGIDLRRALEAVSKAPDSEFVSVQTSRETVRVAKSKGYLLVRTAEGSDKKMNARVPLAVVSALLSGKNDELNLVAAIQALGAHGDGELVTIDDEDTRVRIWIDDQNTAP